MDVSEESLFLSYGNSLGIGDPYRQTIEIIRIAKRVLEEAGSGLKDVIRTRMYVTDISMWEEVGKAHGEFFKEIRSHLNG